MKIMTTKNYFRILPIIFSALFFNFHAYASEIITIKLYDGEMLTGKLSLPTNTENIKELIIFIHGTGPATYDEHRKMSNIEFNYFDLYVNEFNNRGIAFFAYNRRGVSLGTTPPFYDSIDKIKYQKYLPSNEVKDIGTVIDALKNDKRLQHAKIVLLGWSEGTILAAMAADTKKSKVDALFLAGYCNENMFDIIKWQYSGEPSMLNIKKYFDTNNDDIINRQEYESKEKAPTSFRSGAFKNAKFTDLDLNKDSIINSEDFKLINSKKYAAILNAYEKNDSDWIWNNYFRITVNWLSEHFKLEPNKTRLPRLKIPIYIFQGEDDANTSVKGVYEIEKLFSEKQKSNLHIFVFKEHDHDLNYLDFPKKKEISEGIKKIFDISQNFNK